MTKGIYCYVDKKDNQIIYVGKDSHIEKNKRHSQHFEPSRYDQQQINRVLQNNPDRYTYQMLVWDVENDSRLNALEIQYIRQLQPKFNYTEGGDGILGFKHSEESKKNMSEVKKGENNPFYNKHHSEEAKRRISKANKGKSPSKKARKKMSEAKKGKNHPNWGKKRPEHSKKIKKLWENKERRKKHSESMKERWKDEEYRKKMSKANSKYTLWDTSFVDYKKGNMFRRGREPNPVKCFRVRYKTSNLRIGGFIDFLTPEIINNLIKDALNEN